MAAEYLHVPNRFELKKAISPYLEGYRFFLYKTFKPGKNPRHLRYRCSNPREAIHSSFRRKRNPFGNCPSQFSEKMFKRGLFNKEQLSSCRGSNKFDSHLWLGFPLVTSVRLGI